ncbi:MULTISPECIES: hypothetical protein [Bradyrhizobium]|nr:MULTISPECIES: hypothetical protein [Bradyrhizobium]
MKSIDIGAAPQASGGHIRSGEQRLGGSPMASLMRQSLSSRNTSNGETPP